MACEPFDCERCGNRHVRCKGHVVICPVCVPDRDERPEARPLQIGDPCLRCGEACTERDCHRWPRPSQEICPAHGGNAPLVRAKGIERARAQQIRAMCDEIGLSRDVDPGEGLMELVREAAGNVEFYRSLIQDMPVHPAVGDAVTTTVDSSLYGPTYHQSGIPTGEAKRNILLVMYDDERDRFAKYCDMALKAGVEERRVRLAESDAREFFDGIGEAIKAAELTPEQTEVFRATLIARFRGSSPGSGPVGPPASEVPARSGGVGE